MSEARAWSELFDVDRELGEGGVAQVYRARRRSDGTLVALKILREEFRSDLKERERLRREAVAIASIKSPHVCQVFEFDIVGHEAYIAMEYVEGTTLRDVIVGREWNKRDVATVVCQIAESLHAAHACGIIHRDLKPENVMLTGAEQRVKVLDFGFAKLLELERAAQVTQLTRVGTCFGTPHYMSPEQTRARPLDARSDLFALGVIAYELVGGRRPWDGTNPRDVMIAVASKPAPKLGALRPDLEGRRAELDAFFERALAKDPAARFQTARELSLDFERALGSLHEMPANVPEEWYSELSSRVLTFRDLLAPVAALEARKKQTAADTDTIISAWHQPLDHSAPIRVDAGGARGSSGTERDRPVRPIPAEHSGKVKVSDQSGPIRVRAVDPTAEVRLPPTESADARRAREKATRPAGPAPPPRWLIVALVALVLVGLVLLALR